MIGEHLSWSHVALVLCLFYLACCVAYLWAVGRRERRRRSIYRAYRASIKPHHTTQRNGPQAPGIVR
jgi:hypothetical protein